jgi:ketosteroid isomerase-like protein
MNDEHKLTSLYELWFSEADPAEAAAALAPALSDDFLAFGPAGHRAGRGEYMASLRDRRAAECLGSLRITSVPGCLIARGEILAGSPATGRRFTSVWLQDDGDDWRCVTHHETEEEGS